MILSLALLAFPAPAPAPQDTLEEHGLFSRLALEELPSRPQIRFLVEEPRRPDPDHMTSVESFYGPWLEAVARAVEDEYAIPGRLESKSLDGLPVVILGSVSTYTNAKRYESMHTDLSEWVVFLDPPGIVATHWDRTLRRAPAPLLRAPVLRVVALHLLENYLRSDKPLEPWLRVGIPAYLSAHDADSTPADVAHPEPWGAAMDRLGLVIADSDRRGRFLMSLAAMVDCEDEEHGAAIGREHARLAEVQLDDHPYDPPGSSLFAEQASLWVHFLHQGRAGRYRDNFRRYVAKALHGNGGSEEMARTLGLDSLDELNTPFLAHLDLLAGGGLIDLPQVASTPTARLYHPELIQTEDDLNGNLISALALASTGDLEGAILNLESASLRTADPAERETMLEEQSRLLAARDLRDAFLASLPGTSRKLRLTRGEESLSVKVEKVTDEVMHFGENRLELSELPLRELMPADLMRSMGNRASKHGPDWVAAYLDLLAGNERWDRKLKPGEPQDADLAVAVREGLGELIQAARLQARLLRLAATPAPTAPFEAEALLAQCTGILTMELSGAKAPGLLWKARPALSELAHTCWGLVFDHAGLEGLVSVPVKKLPDGRVRLTYEFNDAEEAADFVRMDEYLKERWENLFAIQSEGQSGLSVAAGQWRGRGHAVYRHPIVFRAPLTVRYELLYGRARPGKGIESTVLLGICDDGAGNYVGAWDLFDLESIDIPSLQIEEDYEKGERPLRFAHGYAVELRHDGTNAELWVEGQLKAQVLADQRTSGSVVVLAHSQVTVAIRRLEIEGIVAPEEVEAARRDWVATKVREMGLGQ